MIQGVNIASALVVLAGYQAMKLLKQGPLQVKSYLLCAVKFISFVNVIVQLPVFMGWFIKYHELAEIYDKTCMRDWNAVIFANYCLILIVTLFSTLALSAGLILLWLILPVAIEIVVEGRLETAD
jgi:hypothetical protein